MAEINTQTKPKLWDYIKAAFSARPWGLIISPNWLMLGLFTIAGLAINSGFLLLGAGIEVLYLKSLALSPRFQKIVQDRFNRPLLLRKQEYLDKLYSLLPDNARFEYTLLKETCSSILDFYAESLEINQDALAQHAGNLDKLLYVFLQLLLARKSILSIVPDNKTREKNVQVLQTEVKELQLKISSSKASEELQQAWTKKTDILNQRIQTLDEAGNKLAFISEELDRIKQQVTLIKERAAISKDSLTLSTQADAVAALADGASAWVQKEQSLFGRYGGVNMETPPAILGQKEDIKQ
jgi:hypothetical protein